MERVKKHTYVYRKNFSHKQAIISLIRGYFIDKLEYTKSGRKASAWGMGVTKKEN